MDFIHNCSHSKLVIIASGDFQMNEKQTSQICYVKVRTTNSMHVDKTKP